MLKFRFHALALACALVPSAAFAADHVDSPAATNEPGADITDVYAWMNADATKLNLAVDVFPFAGDTANFSDAVVYAAHVGSTTGYGLAETDTKILCHFYKADGTGIECWAGAEYLHGDPTDPAGITSESGKLRVFAGLRDDPFFFELNGFKHAVATVTAAASALTFDADGCPAVDAGTSAAVVSMLSHGTDGTTAASNTFAGANILSIVVQVDVTVVNAGGPVLAVWASTHAKQ